MALGSSTGRGMVFNSSLQDGQPSFELCQEMFVFFSRQKVNCFNFCGCKFYYLCHKPISAQLWEFTLVTVKDITFKAFLYNNTNKKNIGVIFVEAHQTNNILYKSSLTKS